MNGNLAKKLFIHSMAISVGILLRNMEDWPTKVFWRRVALHGLCLYMVVISMAWLLGEYQDTGSLVGISFVFLIVYVFVWISSRWLTKQDAKKITLALDTIRDSE